MTHPETLVRDVSNLCFNYDRFDPRTVKGGISDRRDGFSVNSFRDRDIHGAAAISGNNRRVAAVRIMQTIISHCASGGDIRNLANNKQDTVRGCVSLRITARLAINR